MKKKVTISIILAIVIAGGLSVYSYTKSGKGSIGEEGYSPHVGDNLKLKVNAVAPLVGTIRGSLVMELVKVSENTYTTTTTPSGDLTALMDQETETHRKDEPSTKEIVVENGTFLGTERVSTKLGEIETVHYRYENETEEGLENTDYWMENKTKMPIIIKIEGPMANISIKLVATNIEEIKEKAER